MRFLPFLMVLYAPVAAADLFLEPQQRQGHGGHGQSLSEWQLKDPCQWCELSAELIHSDLQRSELPVTDRTIAFKSTGKNSYHMLVVRENGEKYRGMAVRYLYQHGRPVDHSPAELLALSQGALEIVPDPLPREHWRYTSGDNYRFVLRFKGLPLPEQAVLAVTEYGSTELLYSDGKGIVTLTPPSDFPEIIPVARKTPPGELRLFTELNQAGTEYRTSLTMEYHANADNWKSTGLGAGVALAGGLFGLWLNRRIPAHQRRKPTARKGAEK